MCTVRSCRSMAAGSQPGQYPTVQAMVEMDRILAAKSGGELRLRIYPGGQLGSEHDTLEITLFGGLDLNRVNFAPLNAVAAETLVLALPFPFSSISHLRRSLDGALGRRIIDSLIPHGLRGLRYYDSGERCFYNTRRPIRTPEDMHGLKRLRSAITGPRNLRSINELWSASSDSDELCVSFA